MTSRWFGPILPLAVFVLLVSTIAWVRVPLLPEIGADLSLSPTQLGWVVTGFGLGRLAMDLPAGRLADRVDPLGLFTLAALTMAVAGVVLSFAPSMSWAVTASVLLGAGSATSNTTGMTAMSGAAPDDRRGSAMALYSGSLLVGQAVGPVLGGLVAHLGGTWRAAAATGAALALLVAAGAALTRRTGAGARAGRVRRDRPPPSGPPLSKVQVTILAGVGFSVFFTVGAMPQTLIPVLGADDLHLDAGRIGLALGLGGLARILGAALTGMISDRWSRRAALLPCLALQAAGVAVLAVGESMLWWLLAIAAMSLGASGHSVGATMLGDRVPPTGLGKALGRYRFAADVGLLTGPVLSAWVYEVAGRQAAVGAVCAVLVVTMVAAVSLPETRPGREARRRGRRRRRHRVS